MCFSFSQLIIQLYLFKLNLQQRLLITFCSFLGISETIVEEHYTFIIHICYVAFSLFAVLCLVGFLIENIGLIKSAKIGEKVTSVTIKVILMHS